MIGAGAQSFLTDSFGKYYRSFLVSICLMLFSSGHLFAQDTLQIDKVYLKSYFTGTIDVLASPLQWKQDDLLKFGVVAGTGVVLFAYDRQIQDFFLRNRTSFTENVAYITEMAGDKVAIAGGLGLFYIYGLIWKDQKAKNIALAGARNSFVTGVYTQIGKYTFQRMRPFQTESPYMWIGPFRGKAYNSFPSGHSSASFALAATISDYSENLYVPVIAYTISSLTMLSRIHHNKHWSSDVWIGASLGHFISKKLNNPRKDKIYR